MAELGHVGANSSDVLENSSVEAYYTDPDQAKEFVEQTNVDALAIAVGSAHGAYHFPPQLDFKRISEIAKRLFC